MQNIKLLNHSKRDIEMGRFNLTVGHRTLIMGILNVTPDSFSDGGDFFDVETALAQGRKMVEQGADIIDIGGESTRPGSDEVNCEEELRRVIPIVRKLSYELSVPISIDTYKARVAEEAVMAGASIINDIWGLQRDPDMARIAAEYNVPVIMMHNKKGTDYEKDIIAEIIDFLNKSIKVAKEAGIDRGKLIIDPGIGFGKTLEQNMEVMARLGELHVLGCPILLGTSRKSMIGKILDLTPKERIEGTIATTVMGIIQGVDIVRVHDVVENLRVIKVTDAIVRRK